MSEVNQLQSHQIVTDIRAFNDLRQTARENPKEALRAVAEQFEAIFVQKILEESRKVQLDGGWMDGGQSEFYQSWHDEQLSQLIATKGSLGLADIIVEQLSPKSPSLSPAELESYKQKMADRDEQKRQETSLNPVVSMPVSSTQNALSLRPFVP